MAYLSDNDPNNPDNTQAAQQQRQQFAGPQNPTTGGGSGGLFGAAPPSGATATGNAAPQSNSSNTGWVNLQSYLDANQPQAAEMGQQVAGSVDKQAQAAQGGVDSLSNAWGQQVAQNTTAADPDAVNKALTDASGLKAGQTLDAGDATGFQKQAGATFNAPTDFTTQAGYGAAANDVNNAQNAVKSTKSEAGRDVLLRNEYGKNGKEYTQGENTLDQALVENNADAQKAMTGLQDKWSGLSGALGMATAKGNQAAQDAVATDKATADAAAKAAGSFGDASGTGEAGALGTWAKGVYDQGNKATTDYSKGISDINQAAGTNRYTPEQLASLGLTQGQQNYGVRITPEMIQAGLAPTVANAASADNYAQMNALAQLAGYLPGGAGTTGTAPLNPGNAGQAGTAAGTNGNAAYTLAPKYASDVAAAQAGVPGAESKFISDYQNLISQQSHAAGLGDQGSRNPMSFDPNSPNYVGNYLNGMYAPKGTGSVGGGSTEQIADYTKPNDAIRDSWSGIQNILNGAVGGGQAGEGTINVGGDTLTGTNKLHPMFAKGGSVPSATVAGPPKEPKIPKLPKPDSKLPTMPHFADGGEADDNKKKTLGQRIHFPGSDEDAPKPDPTPDPSPSPSAWSGLKAALSSNFQAGGQVPGQPKVDHNSYANDTVTARLSPKEIVLPLSVTESQDPVKAAADFVAATLAKKKAA